MYMKYLLALTLVSMVQSDGLKSADRGHHTAHGGPGGGSHDNDKTPPRPSSPRQDDDPSYDKNGNRNDDFKYISSGIGGTERNQDDFYSTKDDYDASTERHFNNGRRKQSVDIVIRPWSHACPRVFNPSIKNDKDLLVAILGSSDFDAVTDIDVDSIILSGSSGRKYVKAASWNWDDVSEPSDQECSCGRVDNPDGRTDLLVRFSASDVAKIPEIADADENSRVKLTITGVSKKNSNTVYIGKDCLKVV
jgi:hypothetical protein